MIERNEHYVDFFYAGIRGHTREFLPEQHLHQICGTFEK